MRLRLLALTALGVGLLASHPSRAQVKMMNFGSWSLHTSAPEGGRGCYFGSQLSNSIQNIEIRVAADQEYKLHMTLLEADWATLPDTISPVVTMKFTDSTHELFHLKAPGVKIGNSIKYDLGRDSDFVDTMFRAAERFTVDLTLKTDPSSAAPPAPMPSEINLPWVAHIPLMADMTQTLVKCDQDNTPEAEKPSILSSMSGEAQKSTLLVLYIDYAIADRCAAASASFNKQQVDAMHAFIASQISKVSISRQDNDEVWNAVQSQLTAKKLTQQDCEDTRKQAAYLFPPATFMSGGAQNPF